jgi:two-component system, NtrC family, nitrogen regulation response regulator NtrX
MKPSIAARILVVDDEAVIRRTFRSILEMEPYEIDEACDGTDCLVKVKQKKYDVIFLDIKMPRVDGLEVLDQLQVLSPESSVIMISGHGNIETAVDCVKKGAFDYLQKPMDINRILISIRNALDRSSLITEAKVLKRKAHQFKIQEIIGESVAIKKVKDKIELAAPWDASRVLIMGPNGTGKELVARWIHEKSPRKDAPFVEVNCAAIPSELIESTMFGHIKGSFTGAVKDQSGKFEQAHGGTLFLDEIGDMSLDAQAKILRALQEKKISRIGGEKDVAVDVRVIAATNKNLREEIAHGRFREDLYNRLEVIDIYVPSLNERVEDIQQLVEQFTKVLCEEYGIAEKRFNIDAIIALQNIDWTGNIRQLRNVVERLIILCRDKQVISDTDIHEHIQSRKRNHPLEDLFNRFSSMDELLRYMGTEYMKFKGKPA